MKRFVQFIVPALLSLAILTSCSLTPTSLAQSVPPQAATPPSAPAVVPVASSANLLTALEGTLQNIYIQVNPSVVNIRVVQKEEASSLTFPQIPGFPFFTPPTEKEPQYRQGSGSGFIWDKEGHIVTNNHVVAGADKITVTFYDGTTIPAEVAGTDPDSDLAVIKVDLQADQLQPVQIADSTQVKVGQLAVAIGNPFGLEGTMTVGFVSAVGRLLPIESESTQGHGYSIPDIIQTDAPINPGNSGGILVDDQGQVIGITSAIISPVRASAGIGFAIPSAIVNKVVPILIKTGQYDHAWLGISGTSLNPDLAKAMKLPSDQRGALVVDVVPEGPADKAGLHGSDRQVKIEDQDVRVGGDVIVAIDGQPVKSFDDIVTYLARATEAGQEIGLTVLRDTKEKTIQVTLATRPKAEEGQDLVAERDVNSSAWLGIRGQTISPEVAQAMDLPEDQQGILVEQVETNSPANKAGLRGSFKPVTINGQQILVGGDVITALDGQPVTQVEDLQSLIRHAEPGQEITLTLLRDGDKIELPVTLGERPATGQ